MSLQDVELVRELAAQVGPQAQERVVQFYELLIEENKVQNLTRLVSPQDFKNGHLVDVLELLKTQWVRYPAVDLGSGCGVPGLLAAAVDPSRWVLVESEKRKADFLQRTVQKLALTELVEVRAERLENYLRTNSTPTIVARAVGSVERIYSWIFKCSTWNELVLFKGPGWEDEWSQFQKGRFKNKLSVLDIYSYCIEDSGHQRKIIKLGRN